MHIFELRNHFILMPAQRDDRICILSCSMFADAQHFGLLCTELHTIEKNFHGCLVLWMPSCLQFECWSSCEVTYAALSFMLTVTHTVIAELLSHY